MIQMGRYHLKWRCQGQLPHKMQQHHGIHPPGDSHHEAPSGRHPSPLLHQSEKRGMHNSLFALLVGHYLFPMKNHVRKYRTWPPEYSARGYFPLSSSKIGEPPQVSGKPVSAQGIPGYGTHPSR